MKKSYLGYLIEGIVISLSILLSLFLGNINEFYTDTEKKNNYLNPHKHNRNLESFVKFTLGVYGVGLKEWFPF